MNDTRNRPVGQDYRVPFLMLSIDEHPRCFDTCPHSTTLTGWSDYFNENIIIALTCKRWGCRYCGENKARALGLRVASAEPNRLITLTVSNSAWGSPREAFEGTRRQVAELTKVIRKKAGSFEYVRILEVTKKGWPHYHLVARSPYIKQSWLSSAWSGLTGAPIVDIRSIKKVEYVYSYVVKYLCKQKYIPWTNRRVTWSKGFFPAVETTVKGKWGIRMKNWIHDPPQEFFHRVCRGSVITKVGAEAWIFQLPERDALRGGESNDGSRGPRDYPIPGLILDGPYS